MIFNVLCSLLLVSSGVVCAQYTNGTQSYTPYTKTLSPTYSVLPQETTLTYSDETTTFYLTSTVYSTHWFTPSPSATITSAPTTSTPALSTSTSEYTTTYFDTDTTYTSTITSAYTITLSSEATTEKAESVSTSVTEIASTITNSGSTYTSTLTSTLLVTVRNSKASATATVASTTGAASDIGALEKLVSAESQSQAAETASSGDAQCNAATQYVTITATPVTKLVTTTAEPVVQYVTVTAGAGNITTAANNGTHI
ncbi:Svs1p [Saccharomyces eubayanus]|uniref:Svs1p n=1 Tax=Saccharomyces eubayanus TaxID=1080349 RepID=UPI0006C14D54|nr:SVS1-like protein [Saccharomyces eubayanus]KOG96155.1 SVS1-like protein [Saccharomyces eubayanus]